MRIGLYGLPCAGKSFILNKIDFLKVIEGSTTMKKLFPDFDTCDETEKNEIRKRFAVWLQSEKNFITDGHYAFGDKVAFTEADGALYDIFLYLYINPKILKIRMDESPKNQKYADWDIDKWQKSEITALRAYCHEHDKDFFVIDNPPIGYFDDVEEVIEFIKSVSEGYSCVRFARNCTEEILLNEHRQKQIILADGDKTITRKDTTNQIFGYTTHIFDNNFYSGYQTWKHNKNFTEQDKNKIHLKIDYIQENKMPFELNDMVVDKLNKHSYILTSGDGRIWECIAKYLGIKCFYGSQMAADTKFFITKFLRQAGKYVIAYGDSMNDYYMLNAADEGYLITKTDGTISSSLKSMHLGGIKVV